jgi:hypothetical protein
MVQEKARLCAARFKDVPAPNEARQRGANALSVMLTSAPTD